MADDILKEAQEAFAECEAAERHNRTAARDDIRFARLGEQWDEGLRSKRAKEGRPCLTINKLPPFIRQVVNDARQNMPSIKVMPQDSVADPATAAVISGLIRNIEASSDADVAYDTALECAATSGVGYFRLNLAYAHDDNWDPTYVTVQADARCDVPAGFVRLHDAAASGLPVATDPAGGAADAPSDIALSAVAETVAGNYGACRDAVEQVRGWQQWWAAVNAAANGGKEPGS